MQKETEVASTWIVVNPKARHGAILSDWKKAEAEILAALNLSHAQVHFTTAEDHGEKVTREALKQGATQIVVVGGDGTLSDVVQGFFEEGKPISPHAVLMVMPGGRGDDFFKTICHRFPLSSGAAWREGLEILRSGVPLPVDVGMFQLRSGGALAPLQYFLNITSFGYPGMVVSKVQELQKNPNLSLLRKTAWAYVIQGLVSSQQYEPVTVEVKVDGQVFFSGKINYGNILNGRYNSGGICWDPEAKVDDGLFHIVLIEAGQFLQNMKRIAQVALMHQKEASGVYKTTGKKVEVLLAKEEVKKYPLFEVDGDSVESPDVRGAVFEILPRSILIQSPRLG